MDSPVTLNVVKKKVTSILISQPKPATAKSPYYALAEKHGVKVDFRPFIQVEGVTVKEFRKLRINPLDYSAIIMTSKLAITHFFRLCEELRIKMPQEMKYICSSEAVALYLQKYIQYRKRKVSFGDGSFKKTQELLLKYKDKEKFLFPCSNVRKNEIPSYLEENNFQYNEATIYKTVSSDLSDLSEIFYDVIVFYSPSGLKSLYHNFPSFKQNHTRIAVWGNATSKAAEEYHLTVNIKAPSEKARSMTMALDQYIIECNANADDDDDSTKE